MNFNEVNIELACKVFIGRYVNINNTNTLDEIVLDYKNWIGTGAEEYLTGVIYDLFGAKGDRTFYKMIEEMLRPTSDRKFWECRTTDGNVPTYADFGYKPNYIYVYDEFQGKYGKQFRVTVNCENELCHTYSRKQLNESLEVGKYYKICLDKVVTFGKGYKKYCYEIEEIDEETYIKEGIFTRSHLG